jgi:hypothetical protein
MKNAARGREIGDASCFLPANKVKHRNLDHEESVMAQLCMNIVALCSQA